MIILYISPLSSRAVIEQIHQESGRDPGYAIQKFNRLMVKGFIANGAKVKNLSAVPVSSSNTKKVGWFLKKETEDNIAYNYIPFFNIKGIRQIGIFLYSFFYVLFWGFSKRKEKVIVCDALSISLCYGALLATKLNGLRSVGILTDMPGMMVFGNGQQQSLVTRINFQSLSLFTHYVFLTEAMNSVVNTKDKPYIIVEGVVDETIQRNSAISEKEMPRVVMYAGSLHEKYGIKLLVEAFASIELQDVKLVIYGSGPYAKELKELKLDNVEYRGLLPTDEIVKAEERASLLVNPRPTHEEFTKYSFPSKNMEYMASGTPLLTTRLPGIPQEYFPYIYLFKEENHKGFTFALKEVLTKDPSELKQKGEDARAFVLQKKNNCSQTARILELIKQ